MVPSGTTGEGRNGMAETAAKQMETAEDRTLYWTLSFYIPIENIFAHNKGLRGAQRTRFDRETDIPEALTKDEATETLRHAIEPLFNDIADRSRVGRVDDQMFAAASAEDIEFIMPPTVEWTTEGRQYRVAIPPHHRERNVGLRRFWYLHGNGSLSWHLSFRVRYKEDLERDLADGTPSTYYFLSLLQKLAWPKEFRCPSDDATVDTIIPISVRTAEREERFWAFVKSCFDTDKTLIEAIFGKKGGVSDFLRLCPDKASLEVPGLKCADNRSLFFIRDNAFFRLIQPKDGDNNLVSRRVHVTDGQFLIYPDLIEKHAEEQGGALLLGDAYWRAVLGMDGGADDPGRDETHRDPDHERRLAYLFLAGFNQNIIDFTNQEASEVLDSLDPIYPSSDEQKEEGFFIRYANPRAMITYVQRSRTLEVGNDHIGTCPYAFLIHALSMHNEALTSAQEDETFTAIKAISALVSRAEMALGGEHKDLTAGREAISEAEQSINRIRLNAFETYDRHRYVNPFRYDTERDVFDELERLRGTSRLKIAYEAALSSMEEHARDLDRLRKELVADVAAVEAKDEQKRDFWMSLLFGMLGVFGLIQVVFQVDQFYRDRVSGQGVSGDMWLMIGYVVVPIAAFSLLLWWLARKRKKEETPSA